MAYDLGVGNVHGRLRAGDSDIQDGLSRSAQGAAGAGLPHWVTPCPTHAPG